MNKTITAEFDSADQASIALKNVSDHFRGISDVKLDSHGSTPERHGIEWLTAPYGAMMFNGVPQGTGFATAAGVENLAPAAVVFANSAEAQPQEPEKAYLSLTVPAASAGRISSVLYTGGAHNLHES